MAVLKQFRDRTAGTLFSLAPTFRIVRLGQEEAMAWTDDVGILKTLILASEAMYPAIGRWFDQKVVPGLVSGQRIAWVAFEGERAIASAVLKLGKRAKFCHLKIAEDFQDRDLGQMFFSQMTVEARHDAKDIHFTLPESLWSSKSAFFESFGFTQAVKSDRQYRRGETELACSAPFLTVWSSVMSKLPLLAAKFSPGNYSLDNKLLISLKPEYAGRILAGSKLFEVRKRFSKKWVGCRAALYSSSPHKALVGEATIRAVTCGKPSDVWEQFGASLGCTFDEFKAYVGSAGQVSAIELSDVTPYRERLSLAQMSHLIREDLRPPQSYCDLRLDDDQNAWVKAVSVASLLHGRFAARHAENSNR
jgi:predicted transcriptional regulator